MESSSTDTYKFLYGLIETVYLFEHSPQIVSEIPEYAKLKKKFDNFKKSANLIAKEAGAKHQALRACSDLENFYQRRKVAKNDKEIRGINSEIQMWAKSLNPNIHVKQLEELLKPISFAKGKREVAMDRVKFIFPEGHVSRNSIRRLGALISRLKPEAQRNGAYQALQFREGVLAMALCDIFELNPKEVEMFPPVKRHLKILKSEMRKELNRENKIKTLEKKDHS